MTLLGRSFFVHERRFVMSSNENNNLTNPDWVARDLSKYPHAEPRIMPSVYCPNVPVWLGLTAVCRYCGELIEIVDMADEGPGVYPPGTFEWRHGHGYFSCNRGGGWPMAEPSL